MNLPKIEHSISSDAPWKFDILETTIFVSRIKLSRGNYQNAADSSSTETLYCLISVQWLAVVYEMVTFFRFSEVFKEIFDANG